MKKILVLFSIFMSLFVGCEKHPINPSIDNSLNGTWKVIAYENLQTQQTYTKSSPESELAKFNQQSDDIVITLNQKVDTLYLKGYTVNNEVSGNFKLIINDSLHCTGFGGTKIGEPNWGNWFWDAMYSASSYQLNGNNLTIYYNFQDNKVGRWDVTLIRQ